LVRGSSTLRRSARNDRACHVIDPESVRDEYAKANLQRQIDATDAQIDKLVYELYELTPDEIKIVEGTTT